MKHYDVIVVGGGVSGTALLYTLAKYTTVRQIALIEKYETVGSVNSDAHNNSQTLHVGDIETNYALKKVREVQPAASMVAQYVKQLPVEQQSVIMQQVQKMVLAVGAEEVEKMKQRFIELHELFPTLQQLDASGIVQVEPTVMKGRSSNEPVLALYNTEGYALNFGALAQSFVDQAREQKDKIVDVLLGTEVLRIRKDGTGYRVETNKEMYTATTVVVNTDAHTLHFAQSLGYGKEFSLIPIAGSFYFTPPVLRGKVYTVQDPRLPFAAVHGDMDLLAKDATRWGPTARFFPVLESRKLSSMGRYFRSSGLWKLQTWISFVSILSDRIRLVFLLKNILYEIPFVGKYFFLSQIRKIAPSVRARDIRRATGFGGMRLQRVNINTKELLLGEGKIVGENIIFNMTPSPGASVCLYNAVRDTQTLMTFFVSSGYSFDRERVRQELGFVSKTQEDVSLKESYAS